MNQSKGGTLCAGAAVVDITPSGSVFLYGYPHVRRYSTGIHDPLECAALYLDDGKQGALFVANDLTALSKATVAKARERISRATGLPAASILLSATHTHSGPVMVDRLSNASDSVVPKTDGAYIDWVCGKMCEAAVKAKEAAVVAEIGFGAAQATGVGSNRHDPAGPTNSEVPVLVVRSRASHRALAGLLVYGMHPTVLHEDSTLISADFPYFTRRYLREQVLGHDCAVLYLQGASGNQSPRHVTRANTFAEAERIGENLARTVGGAIENMTFGAGTSIEVATREIELTPRSLPSIDTAVRHLEEARGRYENLRAGGAPRPAVRTAECDVFGAEQTAELAIAAADGRLTATAGSCLPAEIQAIAIGPRVYVGWPGEFFVEYALELRERAPKAVLITQANGELQGYIVTPETATTGYEATNAVFAATNGARFVRATIDLLAEM